MNKPYKVMKEARDFPLIYHLGQSASRRYELF